jgi:hypothetical protein
MGEKSIPSECRNVSPTEKPKAFFIVPRMDKTNIAVAGTGKRAGLLGHGRSGGPLRLPWVSPVWPAGRFASPGRPRTPCAKN